MSPKRSSRLFGCLLRYQASYSFLYPASFLGRPPTAGTRRSIFVRGASVILDTFCVVLSVSVSLPRRFPRRYSPRALWQPFPSGIALTHSRLAPIIHRTTLSMLPSYRRGRSLCYGSLQSSRPTPNASQRIGSCRLGSTARATLTPATISMLFPNLSPLIKSKSLQYQSKLVNSHPMNPETPTPLWTL